MINKLRSLLKYDPELLYMRPFSIEGMLEKVSECMISRNEELSKTSLVFLRELSFVLKKVLDSRLECLLSGLFEVIERSEN